jgi:hypothetical protein
MGKRDVLLHLCGLFRSLRSGVAATGAGREDGAARTCDSNGLAGDFGNVGDPERHDFLVAGVEAQFQSLAEHRLGRALYRDYPHDDVEMGILYILWSYRDRADGTRGLVCMELAQAESSITERIFGCPIADGRHRRLRVDLRRLQDIRMSEVNPAFSANLDRFPMHHRIVSLLILSIAVANSVTAKCMFAPKIRGSVSVESCVGVTFEPGEMGIDFGGGRIGPWYAKGSSYSGTLLSVQVKESHFVWDDGERHRTNGFKPWVKGKILTLFVAAPVGEVCPRLYGDVIAVETDGYCCDVLPVKDRCLVPGSIPAVHVLK